MNSTVERPGFGLLWVAKASLPAVLASVIGSSVPRGRAGGAKRLRTQVVVGGPITAFLLPLLLTTQEMRQGLLSLAAAPAAPDPAEGRMDDERVLMVTEKRSSGPRELGHQEGRIV